MKVTVITRRDDKSIGARIFNIDSFTAKELDDILSFWKSHDNYEIEIV